jgi:hypothetical protein
MMYAFTFDAVVLYVYVFDSGRLRWSMRSMPQVAFGWVSLRRTIEFCSTYATRGSAASALALSVDMEAEKPLRTLR